MENITKAQMLKYLKTNISNINILPFYILESDSYFKDKKKEVNKIINNFTVEKVIIRSSSKSEDTNSISNAGKYKSILNVSVNERDLEYAIEKVYKSYGNNDNEEILIQPMMENIIKSGVVFTSDIYTYAPYYTINYEEGKQTDAVTSGETNNLKTYIYFRNSPFEPNDFDMSNLINLCSIIEQLLNNSALDIEFAIDTYHQVFIFQVRPIASGKKEYYDNTNLDASLKRIFKKINKLNKKHPFLLGDKTCFGVMPDWNPAEILGIRPKKLAISLYKELITDNIWAHQREDYGYRDLTMHPLMVSFCGIPYIDTRITFNSFIPRGLNNEIAEKLVNYYLKRLAEYPAYHDKVEFEIVFSCYYLGLPNKLKNLSNYGFNDNEIKRIEFALLELTNNIIHPDTGLYIKDLNKIKVLNENYDKIINSDISLIDKIYWLIEECKAYGTLPFAGIARAGFIAIQFMRSFVELKIISIEEYNKFMNSLNTVNRQLSIDLKKLYKKNLSKENFLNKYGHIRPGTYDILSPRYDEDFFNYFGNNNYLINDSNEIEEYYFSNLQLKQIQLELDQNGIEITSAQLISFIKESIEGREYLKFVFTKSVSKILQLVEELGKRLNIKKDDVAHLDINTIKNLYVDLYYGDLKNVFNDNIKKNKKQFEMAKLIKLPSIIIEPKDIYCFFLLEEEPNFITLKTVVGKVVLNEDINKIDLDEKIIFIKSADPGYDFLFSKGIGGLITQFGGANSHMAIRCAELGIPAVIGSGEKNFNNWQKAEKLQIDCLRKKVIPMNLF